MMTCLTVDEGLREDSSIIGNSGTTTYLKSVLRILKVMSETSKTLSRLSRKPGLDRQLMINITVEGI
jgi:hypothetical protein